MTPTGPAVSDNAEQRIEIRKGDTLRVLTRDGARRDVVVSGVDETHLIGRSERIAYADMVFVERLETQADLGLAATLTGLVLATLYVVPAIGAAAVLSAGTPR